MHAVARIRPLAPDEPLCLLGDVHGRLDLLERFLKMRQNRFPEARLVVLGDMIDRGPDTAGVLRLLQREAETGAICLAGNHEAMFLAFMASPQTDPVGWLRHGGLNTLESFGEVGLFRNAAERVALRDRLRRADQSRLEAWLTNLPSWFRSGNLVAVHAAMDPALPPEVQELRVLQWGHPAFGRQPRHDGLWVAHGHVVVDRAFSRAGVISLDTGAYATGRLSFALVDPRLPEAERLVMSVTP